MDGEDLFASSAFIPLPYRVFSLVGLGILCWATNLHILKRLGIDPPSVLDTRSDKSSAPIPASPWPSGAANLSSPPTSPHRSSRTSSSFGSSALHPPVYRLFILYSIWILATYVVFNLAVKGDMQKMDRAKGVITLCGLGVVAGLLCPFDILLRRERYVFITAIGRCLNPPSGQAIFFCDVILADIFTSFAKVLGDFWVSACMILPGGSLKMSALDVQGVSEWIIPALISVPYVIRFRQCLIEYYASSSNNTRSLYNAIKYATSFPVIFLSAMQKFVVSDLANADKTLGSTWHGENGIFRLWLLSVCVSSVYSFWWDVTNDWGLDILRSPPSLPSQPIQLPLSRVASGSELPLASSPVPQSSSFKPHRSHAYGLRPQLLFGYPLIYYAAIALNLILRFTWSMKLSTHLHTFAQLETGVFVVEACELLRRWLWVFFRVEWEACKRGMMPVEGVPIGMLEVGTGEGANSRQLL